MCMEISFTSAYKTASYKQLAINTTVRGNFAIFLKRDGYFIICFYVNYFYTYSYLFICLCQILVLIQCWPCCHTTLVIQHFNCSLKHLGTRQTVNVFTVVWSVYVSCSTDICHDTSSSCSKTDDRERMVSYYH